MKVIIVTGCVGTGKTTVAKKFSEVLGYNYLDVNSLIKRYDISSGFDKKRKSKIIDIEKLKDCLVRGISKLEEKKVDGVVIDSHLSHYLDKDIVDLCIVTKCELKELEKRLLKRKYHEEKIRENLDSEIFDTCRVEALEAGHNIKIIETDREVKYGDLMEVVKKL